MTETVLLTNTTASLQDIKDTLRQVEQIYRNANARLPEGKRLDAILATAVFTFAPDKPFGSKNGVYLRSWVRAGKSAPWREKQADGKIIQRPEFNTNPSVLSKGIRAVAHAVLQNVRDIWAYVYQNEETSRQGRYHSQGFKKVDAILGFDSQVDKVSNSGWVLAENAKVIADITQGIDASMFNLWREQDRTPERTSTGIYSTWACPASCPPPGVPADYDGPTVRLQFRAPQDYPNVVPGIKCGKCSKPFQKVEKGNKKVGSKHTVTLVS